jgi:hypothetical protein
MTIKLASLNARELLALFFEARKSPFKTQIERQYWAQSEVEGESVIKCVEGKGDQIRVETLKSRMQGDSVVVTWMDASGDSVYCWQKTMSNAYAMTGLEIYNQLNGKFTAEASV